jgi:hypothetical protein
MFIFLIFYIGIWAVMATFLFGPNPLDQSFNNLGDSFTQLFVLITTCNYPSVMLPAYTKSQASFIFFFIFIVIGIYFILNLILAIVFRVYTEAERNKFRKRFLRQRAALRFAYKALIQASPNNTGGGVPWEAFNECLRMYGHFKTQKKRRIMFCALNRHSRSGAYHTRLLARAYCISLFLVVLQLPWAACVVLSLNVHHHRHCRLHDTTATATAVTCCDTRRHVLCIHWLNPQHKMCSSAFSSSSVFPTGALSLDEFYEFYNMLAIDWHRSHFSANDGTRQRASSEVNTEMVWSLEMVRVSVCACVCVCVCVCACVRVRAQQP